MTDGSPAIRFAPAVDPASGDIEPENGEPRGRVFAVVDSNLLVLTAEDGQSRIPDWTHLRAWGIATLRHQFLGTLDGAPCWSAELQPLENVPPDGAITGLRPLYDLLSETEYAIAGRAVQIVAWERDHQFCGRCGAETARVPGERARRCPACDLAAYPRISPAIIVLIERGERILLARSHSFATGRYGIVAGFVEPGESLEDAVRREVREEVSLELGGVSYFGSQPWPFPHGIMIGFQATHRRGEIRLADGELAEADWYTLDDLPVVPSKLSIARRLIDDWATRQGAVIDQP